MNGSKNDGIVSWVFAFWFLFHFQLSCVFMPFLGIMLCMHIRFSPHMAWYQLKEQESLKIHIAWGSNFQAVVFWVSDSVHILHVYNYIEARPEVYMQRCSLKRPGVGGGGLNGLHSRALYHLINPHVVLSLSLTQTKIHTNNTYISPFLIAVPYNSHRRASDGGANILLFQQLASRGLIAGLHRDQSPSVDSTSPVRGRGIEGEGRKGVEGR